MNWFRSRLRCCARLALFALAFQFVVSFGHMHRDDLGLPPLAGEEQSEAAFSSPLAALLAAVTTPAFMAAHALPSPPAAPARHSGPDDYCPICASMMLIATAVPALPPVLIVPDAVPRLWPPQAPAYRAAVRTALPFRARAPPLA